MFWTPVNLFLKNITNCMTTKHILINLKGLNVLVLNIKGDYVLKICTSENTTKVCNIQDYSSQGLKLTKLS